MSVIKITEGVKVYQEENQAILFGCPPEIIKHFMNKNIEFPNTIVLPDTPFKFNTLQNCTEFPLYYFLFVQGHFFKGKKLNIVGTKSHLKANRQLLKLTLLGPTKAQYDEIGASRYFNDLYRESRALALKNKDGQECTIDDFINFIPFQEGQATVGDLIVKHTGLNIYSVSKNEIDINFFSPQEPPYDLRHDYITSMPSRFGVTVLGGASGFIADKPCSGLLLNYNSDYMLVDCVPFLEHSLNARGISKKEITSIFLTHVHDDHCNIFPLLEFSNKIKFLATKEIYWMALKKLSLQTLLPIEEFYNIFDFVELTPYESKDFFGISITPHYTVHSIPTIGATFKMKHGHTERSIVFVGDNKSFEDIEKMVEDGLVKRGKYEPLQQLYADRYDILFADGGMGILHGNPIDAVDSKSDRIVFMHLENLPKEFDATFSTANAGKRYTIIPGSDNSYVIKTLQIIADTFQNISNEWTTALMNNFEILTFNIGDIVFKQKDESKGVIYIILSGSCSIMVHDGESLKEKTRKEAGDFVGEMAVLDKNKIRSASVVARTPVNLCAIDESLFYQFLVAESRVESMRKLWKIRSEIEQNYPFSSFADSVNDKIAMSSNRRSFTKGEIAIE